jgi:hypothetical protein
MIKDDRLRDLFRRAGELKPVTEPELLSADEGQPEVIPDDLRARVLTRAADRSAELLGARIREATKIAGWSPDDWASEAGSKKREALDLASGSGDPACLPAPLLARLFSIVGLDPRDILGLLKQAVASNALFSDAAQGLTYARTAGLSCAGRAAALESGSLIRDVDRGARVANQFADEVVERWLDLKKSED